jgi:hypothetical protein
MLGRGGRTCAERIELLIAEADWEPNLIIGSDFAFSLPASTTWVETTGAETGGQSFCWTPIGSDLSARPYWTPKVGGPLGSPRGQRACRLAARDQLRQPFLAGELGEVVVGLFQVPDRFVVPEGALVRQLRESLGDPDV